MFERFLRALERVAKIQPQLTILILLLVIWGSHLITILQELKGVFL